MYSLTCPGFGCLQPLAYRSKYVYHHVAAQAVPGHVNSGNSLRDKKSQQRALGVVRKQQRCQLRVQATYDLAAEIFPAVSAGKLASGNETLGVLLCLMMTPRLSQRL